MNQWPHQVRAIEEIRQAIESGKKRILVTGPTGSGKCLGRGTPILMYDGRVKNVEDVRPGDLLMGPDSNPKTVRSICCGEDNLYKVVPVKGESYIVNEAHILSLVCTVDHPSMGIRKHVPFNITVPEYLKKSKWFKHLAKGWRTGVSFEATELHPDLPPYILGIWLGDGSSNVSEITNADSEVVSEWKSYCDSLGHFIHNSISGGGCPRYRISCGIRNRFSNRAMLALRFYGLIRNKHIPHSYKTSSRKDREELLAGIIDTDGHMTRGGFDYVSMHPALAQDVCFLARSLGLAAYINLSIKSCTNSKNDHTGIYWRVYISGDCSNIPCRIKRKRSSTRRQIKSTMVTGIRVVPTGRGDYFGFELDGDGLFMLGDFTVTHNTLVIQKTLEMRPSAALYSDRKLLLDQTSQRLDSAGFSHGIRAAGHDPSPISPIQLCMVQTEDSKVLKSQIREHHKSELVVLDEAHKLKGDTVQELVKRHLEDGAVIVGFTATPLNLGSMYDHLIVMATNSECRACGAHVVAFTHAPDEPDLNHVKRAATGEFEVTKLRNMFMRPVIFGRVLEHWKKLGGEQRPTLLFGPDVMGARWFCEEFNKNGIRSGHIDADEVLIGDVTRPNNEESRADLIKGLVSGDIKIASNRFILREGLDVPIVSHLIFATAFGSLTSYLQAAGRGMRTCEGKKDLIIQDHGGNWWRHGSVNSDRIWELGQDDYQTSKKREDALREKKEAEPIVCPNCTAVRKSGRMCPACGNINDRPSRVVIQLNGELRQVRGDIYKPRRVSNDPQEVKDWKNVFFRCRNAKKPMTFNQAAGLFFRDHGQYPNPSWPLMPKDDATKYRHIRDVAISELNR